MRKTILLIILGVLLTIPLLPLSTSTTLADSKCTADSQCTDNLYYVDSRYGEGACIHKYSGYCDPTHTDADAVGCIYTFEGADNSLCAPAGSAATTAKSGLGSEPAGVLQLQQIIQRIINLAVEAGFVFSGIMLVIAGIKYLTSGGEPKAVESAGMTITWALLGVLFLAISWIIILLLKALTGVDLTKFCLGFPGVPTACPI